MAEDNLESPANPPAAIPEKPWWQSNSMWVSAIAVISGMLSQNGAFGEIAMYLGANKEALVGWVMQGIGFYGAFAALRRNSVLTIRK